MTSTREALDREESYLQSHFNHDVGGVTPSDIEGAFHRVRATLPAAPGEPSMSVESALAYADGYKEGLDDCERADVGTLIEQVASLEGRLSFEKALKSDAERRFAEQAAYVAELEDKQRAIRTPPQPAAGWNEAKESDLPMANNNAEIIAKVEANRLANQREIVAQIHTECPFRLCDPRLSELHNALIKSLILYGHANQHHWFDPTTQSLIVCTNPPCKCYIEAKSLGQEDENHD